LPSPADRQHREKESRHGDASIKACIEPLPDDGGMDTGLALCACIVKATLNAINRRPIMWLNLKEARDQKTLMST
jgi:hypothetical protein